MTDIPLAARVYVLVVGIGGFALLGGALVTEPLPASPAAFLLLFLLTVGGEFHLIKAPLGSEGVELSFSMAFAFSLLIAFGAPAAALASATASLLGDAVARKAWWKALFNAGQYVLVSLAAGAVFHAVAGVRHVSLDHAFSTPRDGIAAAAAALAYFAVNTLLLSVALGLAQGASVFQLIREESGYQMAGSLAMFATAPIAVVAVGRSPLLLPTLVIPLAVAYRSTIVSVAKEHEALHDSLTGLPNRVLFRLKAIEATTDLDEDAGTTAILLIDLDRFKEINDTLGHGTGDSVLQELGPRLLAAVGEDHTVARLGGDEFGVVLPGISGRDEAEEIAARILTALRAPIRLDDLDLEIGASIGIAIAGAHGNDADTLIQRADVAMYSAKRSGAGQVTYSVVIDDNSPMRLGMVSELRSAVESGALVVYYQPIVSVATGAIFGAEALVRWNHPTRGLVCPDDFIPIAEQSGVIRELTHFVVREALAANARWRRSGYDLSVSVNISARSLHDLDLAQVISEQASVEAVPLSRVVLEITESTIMADPEHAIAALAELRAGGVRISMDDYGTGHSSLAQMKHLPIDELKIEKSFITDMIEGSSDALIAESTVDLVSRLGLTVVAEGVETLEAWRQLHRMGCHRAQGHYFSPAVPGEEFLEWVRLDERRGRLGAGHLSPTGLEATKIV